MQHHSRGEETPETRLCEFQESGGRECAPHSEKGENGDERWAPVHLCEMFSQALDSLREKDRLSFWVAGPFHLASRMASKGVLGDPAVGLHYWAPK